MSPQVPAFGVDLGTTKSAIGWIRDGHPELITIDGDVIVPSIVSWPAEGGPAVVGRRAENLLVSAPGRTVRSSKRWMGTTHTWQIDGVERTPVDAAAEILRYLAQGAERAVGVRPTRVVITVPAWFTVAQRADTRLAGERAGLEVIRLINEPTAAALAHAHGAEVRRRALVYDLGGGTFDVSLVEQDGPVVEVRGSRGDTHLGGDDIDDALVAHVLTRIHDTHGADAADTIRTDPARHARLLAAVETAKLRLSEVATTTLRVPALLPERFADRDLEATLAREDLEELVQPLFLRTTAIVDRLLEETRCAPGELDALLLVGGSTALPLVWSGLFRRYGLQGDARIPTRRAVALGAAVQAGLIDGADVQGVMIDVAGFPLSIGMTSGGVPGQSSHFVCEVITPRNAPLPARHTHIVRTSYPTQQRVRVPLYQGADPDPRRNTILAEVVMEDLPPAPPDEISRPIAVELRHDLDGVVHITITDQLSGRSVEGQVAADGVEQAALRATWERWVEEQGLEWGDPYGHAGHDHPGDPPAPALSSELSELFESVLQAEARVRADAPEAADALLTLAREGRAAAARGDGAAVGSIGERLQDALFEAGVWL